MQKLAGILKESQLNEDLQELMVQKRTKEDGIEQIILTVKGQSLGGEETQINLSRQEAEELKKMAAEFLENGRRPVKKSVDGVNLGIEAKGTDCFIYRQDGSTYNGYGEKLGSGTGRLTAQQSIVYQIKDMEF